MRKICAAWRARALPLNCGPSMASSSLTRRQPARAVLAALLAVVASLAVLLSPGKAAARAAAPAVGEPTRLEVRGHPDAFYYRARGKGSKPVILYLHGRNGNAAEDCRKWAKVATQFGWVLCPQAPGDSGGGGRTWMNDAQSGKAVMDAALAALRGKHKGRVNRYGNILVGFSEGAFVAMQAGLMDQKTWSKWLILAASDRYWVTEPGSALTSGTGGGHLQRVYLLTGETDAVAPNTTRVGALLKKHKVPVKVRIAPGMGHELAREQMITTYRRPLSWLALGR